VKHGDYNVTYNLIDKQDAYYPLYQMLNSISAYVRALKSEAVQQNHYFQYVVENSQVGLMAYDEKGNVILSNKETSRLLGVRLLKNIHQLKGLRPALYVQLSSLVQNQPKLIQIQLPSALKLSARLQQIVIGEKSISLLSLINIKAELDENELQSWQDLISVLTHEIMNSVSPFIRWPEV
jgi:two-component system, NtrC family, nitrogen regulation sensor histidine kinase NtrY